MIAVMLMLLQASAEEPKKLLHGSSAGSGCRLVAH